MDLSEKKANKYTHSVSDTKNENATLIACTPIYTKFKNEAKAQQYTLRAIANVSGLSFSHIRKLLSGERKLTQNVVQILNNVFDTDFQP